MGWREACLHAPTPIDAVPAWSPDLQDAKQLQEAASPRLLFISCLRLGREGIDLFLNSVQNWAGNPDLTVEDCQYSSPGGRIKRPASQSLRFGSVCLVRDALPVLGVKPFRWVLGLGFFPQIPIQTGLLADIKKQTGWMSKPKIYGTCLGDIRGSFYQQHV